jgi:hypothetical protein
VVWWIGLVFGGLRGWVWSGAFWFYGKGGGEGGGGSGGRDGTREVLGEERKERRVPRESKLDDICNEEVHSRELSG